VTLILGPLIAIGYNLTQPMDAAKGSFSLAQAVRGPLCVLMLLTLLLSWGLRTLLHRFTRPLLFLAAYAIVTSFIGPYPYQHIVFAVKMAFIAAIFLNALQLARDGLVGERWLAACAWVVLLTVAVCLGIGLITGRTVAVYQTRYASAGLMNHVSIASIFALSTLPVFIRYVTVDRSALAGLVILYASLFFTMCRSTLIAAAVATCWSFLVNLRAWRHRIPWRRALLPMGVLLVLAGIGLSTPAGHDLMARFQDLNPRQGNGSGRYVFWKISAEHIVHRSAGAQLLGEGVGTVRDVLREHYGLTIGSHNDGLDLIHALGLCGLVGFGWWSFELVRLAWRLRGQTSGPFQGACAAVIILGLTSMGSGGSFEPPWAITYAALGFWAACEPGSQQLRARDV
jgi:hypothetical protein